MCLNSCIGFLFKMRLVFSLNSCRSQYLKSVLVSLNSSTDLLNNSNHIISTKNCPLWARIVGCWTCDLIRSVFKKWCNYFCYNPIIYLWFVVLTAAMLTVDSIAALFVTLNLKPCRLIQDEGNILLKITRLRQCYAESASIRTILHKLFGHL